MSAATAKNTTPEIEILVEPHKKKPKMPSTLDQLKSYTVVVADTGDFEGKIRQPPRLID